MKKHNRHATRRTCKALAALVLAMVFSTSSHAVTFTHGGTFEDTGTWLLTAEFPQSALDDWNVFTTEMTRLDVSVAGGDTSSFPPFTYQLTDFVTNFVPNALVFSGDPTNPTFENFFHEIFGLDIMFANWRWAVLDPPTGEIPNTFRQVTLNGTNMTEQFESNPGDLFTRVAPGVNLFGPLAEHAPANGAVPEPITATLGLMGLGVLGMATRRRVA